MSARPTRLLLRLLWLMAAVVVLIAPAANAQNVPGQSRIVHISTQTGSSAHHLNLSLNKAAIIELDHNAHDVVVANPKIVDAVVRTPRRIFILALAVGQTNAIFLDADGHQIGTLDIAVGVDVNDLNALLRRELSDSNVTAKSLNDNIILSGQVQSPAEAARARDLATKAAGSPDKIVNNIRIDNHRQVLIKVRVSEMQRSVAKQLGVDATAAVGAGGVPIIASTSNPFSLLGRALSDLSGVQVGQCTMNSGSLLSALPSAGTSPLSCSPNNLQGVFRALEQVGLVHTMAEPNLTAVSGEAAKFLAGGEFPVPTSRDRDGNVVVQFKPFGVALAFTPVVLSKNRISLQVSTEVSELTTEGAFVQKGSTYTANGQTVQVAGLTIPALSVRRANTTVELPSGGSLMIGGLLQQTSKQNLDAFPGLKDLPVLGALFRSRDFQHSETELVVMVTAYLVDPTKEAKLTTPDKDFSLPSDLETVLLGRLNSIYGKHLKAPISAPPGSVGYIVQ